MSDQLSSINPDNTHSREKNHAVIYIIVCLILVTVIGTLGYFLGQRSTDGRTTILPISIIPSPPQSPTKSNIPPTDIQEWKEYTNSQFSYSFSYPPDWKVEVGGYSKWEEQGSPFVSKNDNMYGSITFSYFENGSEGTSFFRPEKWTKMALVVQTVDNFYFRLI